MTTNTPTDRERLIPPTALFRFELPCYPVESIWEPQGPLELNERHRLPEFGLLDGAVPFADVRLGWSTRGLAISLTVRGKQQHPWCRHSRWESSDGMCVWISTRETANIHRANRFCHQFVFLPLGRGPQLDKPVVEHVMIQRATEHPKTLPAGALQIRSARHRDGYSLRAAIPAIALTGFDPDEHRRWGFSYAVMDRELGIQRLALSDEYPVASDPSLWSTLELIKPT